MEKRAPFGPPRGKEVGVGWERGFARPGVGRKVPGPAPRSLASQATLGDPAGAARRSEAARWVRTQHPAAKGQRRGWGGGGLPPPLKGTDPREKGGAPSPSPGLCGSSKSADPASVWGSLERGSCSRLPLPTVQLQVVAREILWPSTKIFRAEQQKRGAELARGVPTSVPGALSLFCPPAPPRPGSSGREGVLGGAPPGSDSICK